MNQGKTKQARRTRIAAMTLACMVALFVSPLCPMNCSGSDCRMRETISTQGEDCHGAAQTGVTQIRSAKNMACDAPALAVRADSPGERLWKISRLGAGSSTAEATNLSTAASVCIERGQRWQISEDIGPRIAGTRTILPLRI